MSINLANTTSSKTVIPPYFSDVVTLRVKKSKMGKNDKGVERIDLETEIVAPAEVELDGTKYELAGQEVKFYLSLSDERTGKATQSPLATLKEFHEKLGLPLEFDKDTLPYDGLMFDFLLSSSERPMQRRLKDGSYEPILDGQGKPRTQGWQWNNYISNTIGPSALNVEGGF